MNPRNKLYELRQWADRGKARAGEELQGVARDPWAIPKSKTFIIMLTVLGVVVIGMLFNLLASPETKSTEKTEFGTFEVLCTHKGCGHAWRTEEVLGFDDWPLSCPKCGQPTGCRAIRCWKCTRLFPLIPDSTLPRNCPHCHARN